jgi:hypothetical protein
MPGHPAHRAFAFVLLLLITLPVFAIQKPLPEYRVLENFDSRVGSPVAVPPAVLAALQRIGPRGLNARFNRFSGGAALVFSDSGALTPATAGRAAAIAANFLAAYPDVFGLNSSDLQSLIKTSEYSGLRENITHIDYRQVIGGIGVYAGVGIHINRQGQIVFLTSAAVPDRGAINPVNLTAAQAVLQAASDIRPELSFAARVKSGPVGADQFTVFEAGPFAKDVTARLTLLPTVQGLRLAWETFVEPNGFPQGYITLIDASNGQALLRKNTYQYADGVGNVLQSDATKAVDPRSPDGFPSGSNPPGAGDPPKGCPPINDYFNRSLNSQFRNSVTALPRHSCRRSTQAHRAHRRGRERGPSP